jgi:adenylosuccinate lyase
MIDRYSRPEMSRLWTDQHRFETMLQVELLACEALVKDGEVPAAAYKKIKAKARVNVARIRTIEKEVKHDVIAFVTQVGEGIGPESRYLHLGLTSSDVLDTALAVQMVESADLIIADLKELQKTIATLAKKHKGTLMMGRSHGIHGEPITFGIKVAGWYTEMNRALVRIHRAQEIVRVGKLSGAMGTFAHLDPHIEAYVCKKLNLHTESVATQVIPRDRHAEFVCQLATVAAGIERIATEIRHMQRTEVLEVEEPFSKGQKGSSAMPHKRNPIATENLCGLARLIRGYAHAQLESVALWHERDISHSSVERVGLVDSLILLDFMIHRLNSVLTGLQVYPENMKRNLGLTVEIIASQRVLRALVEKGWRREDAYRVVQGHAMRAWQEHLSFRNLVETDPQMKVLSKATLDGCFNTAPYIRHEATLLKRAGL